MTAFSFSTGNPSNLTGGATASMTDISGSLTDLKTFLNGGSITDTNIQAAGLTDTSLASPTNAVWRTVFSINAVVSALTTTACYFQTTGGSVATGGFGAPVGLWVPITAGDVAVAGKTTRLRSRVSWATNAGAAGITLTWGLYLVNVLGGTAQNGVNLTLGSVIAGSTAAVASPSIDTVGSVTGSSFDLSTLVGSQYVPGVVGSGSQGANSSVSFQYELQMRHT